MFEQKRSSRKLKKSTPGVDFINVLRTPFFVQMPFSELRFAKNALSYEKCVRKALMKLTPGAPNQWLSTIETRQPTKDKF